MASQDACLDAPEARLTLAFLTANIAAATGEALRLHQRVRRIPYMRLFPNAA